MLIDEKNETERLRASSYWLLVRYEGCHASVLTVELEGGQTALPVFSHEDEAESFLSESPEVFEDDGWRVRASGNGQLVSMLYGPCQGVKRVILDPLPERSAGEVAELAGVSKQCFVEGLMGRGRSWFDRRYARRGEG